ncbi:uncharacterized protein DS421_1g14520 [Arachis hypogaea]|nr:uncharacterized protein DS421_1g14520 [Arachis hypogaea]
MGITGCSVGGYMDDTKFNKPMPWIGIYIAAASLACLIAVTVDLIHGIRGRKFWFPCRYFCLNATSLTIIGVALKLSVDLNTPVPQRHDQLAKLSSSALICTIIGNSMPSLGVTDNKETMMNVVAMGILVITMIVNICIQFVTGVIYVFWVEHAIIMLLMLILLMTMFSSAVAIPKMKHYLELKYEMNEEALKESANQVEEAKAEANNQVINSLREELMRFWMMAHTSSPQFVLGRSVTCTASGAFCLLSTMALAEAMLRSYLMPWSFRFCTGHSDYKWSTIMILIVQVAAVAIGCNFFRKLKSKFSHSVSSISSGTESRTNAKFDLRRFVLHLEGEEELVGVMMKDNRDATNHWFQAGEKKEPKHVIELIEKCSILEGFKGVVAFDSDQVPHLHCAEPPNSWSLPLVTLASIIVAIPNIDRCKVRNLIDALNEGLPYVKFIENNLDKEGKLIKVRTAAEIIWLGVDLYQKWHDVDLYKLSLQSESPKETLEKLSEAAKIRYHKFKAKYNHICIRVSPSSWPIKILSSNSMYRISQATLLNHECMKDHSSERLFEALKGMICDILGACLTNLPHVISTKCLNSAIEEREDSVRYSVHVLGKTKKIIEMLEKRAFPVLDFGKGTNIEDWRLMHKQNKFLPFDPCSLENDTLKAPEKSSDCRLNID